MKQNQTQDLTKAPIPGLIKRIAIPNSVGFFFYTMFNVVDTFYAGLISTHALAALSLSFPLFFIITSTASGFGTGATGLIANALGADDHEKARLLAFQGISFGILVSFLLVAVGLWSAPHLFKLMGASEKYLELCLAYQNIIFIFAGLFVMNYMFNAVLNSVGDTKPQRNFLIVGFALNLILDPWFIYGGLGVPAMGIRGVAVATVLIQAMGVVYLWRKAAETGIIDKRGLRMLIPRPVIFGEIIRQGVPPMVNFLTIGIGIFVINYFVAGYGATAIAAYGVAVRVEQIILMPTIGLNTSTLAIVAQNNGAGNLDRIEETVSTSLKYGAWLMAGGGIILIALARPLMSFFTSDETVIQAGMVYMRIDALVLYAYVVLFVSLAALQGIKRPTLAVYIGLSRQIVVPFIVFYALTHLLELGVTSIWWGILGITWSAALVARFYSQRLLKKNREASSGSAAV